MVGPLMILKMLHCKTIRSRASKMPYMKQKGTSGEVSPQSENKSNNFKVKVEKSEDMCRVCLRQGRIPIYGNSTTEDLSSALNTFAAIEVSKDDPYPKYLCQPCHALLQGAISFRKTAQWANEILKKPIENESEQEIDDNFDDFATDTDNKLYDLEEQKSSIPKNLMCKKCDIQFDSFKEYSDHRLSEEHENKKVECPVCKNLYGSEYFKRHIARHKPDGSYMCDICGKVFPARNQFTRHHATHFFHLPFKCVLCPYRGRFSESLKMHMRSHTGEKPYQCAQCPSRFISKSNLNKHMFTHKGEHDFRCELCSRGFYTKRELGMHFKVTHSGVREHVCRICGKAFGYKKQMMKHELTVHKREKLRSGRTPLYLKVESMKQQGMNTTVET